MKTPTKEALKEVSRWVVFFIISWIISETLKQINLVPEFAPIKLWVFTYSIPVRSLFTFVLTMVGRYADKYTHEKNKELGYQGPTAPSMGILPW
jgi:hypothetical protein